MIFRVAWVIDAVDELTNLWLVAPDRERVTAAAAEIDELLRHDPEVKGESRDNNVRILFADPLGVDFEVVDDDRTVYVLSVWRIDGRGGD